MDTSLDAVMIYAEPTTEQLLARIENTEQGGSREEPTRFEGSDRFIVLILHGLPLFPRDTVRSPTWRVPDDEGKVLVLLDLQHAFELGCFFQLPSLFGFRDLLSWLRAGLLPRVLW